MLVTLEVLLFAKKAELLNIYGNGRITSTLQPVPLFETIDERYVAPQIDVFMTEQMLLPWIQMTVSRGRDAPMYKESSIHTGPHFY